MKVKITKEENKLIKQGKLMITSNRLRIIDKEFIKSFTEAILKERTSNLFLETLLTR